ncbi:hypothetical protein Bca4012_045880 [Brassica carinata]
MDHSYHSFFDLLRSSRATPCPFVWKLWPAALVTGKASIPYLLYNPFVFSDEDCLLPERTMAFASFNSPNKYI